MVFFQNYIIHGFSKKRSVTSYFLNLESNFHVENKKNSNRKKILFLFFSEKLEKKSEKKWIFPTHSKWQAKSLASQKPICLWYVILKNK